MNDSSTNTRSSRALAALLLGALAWPPAYAFLVHPFASSLLSPQSASNEEMQHLLRIHRYTLHVPRDRQGWFLSLESVVDGEAKRQGGATVDGGSDIVLLVREITHSDEIEYCWYDGNRASYGAIDDPLKHAGVFARRGEGRIEAGDWLLRGGRTAVSSSGRAEFEVRVALHPPDIDAETEQSHSLKPASGSASAGTPSPPGR